MAPPFGGGGRRGWHVRCCYGLVTGRREGQRNPESAAQISNNKGVTTMTPRIRTASLFGALAAFLWVSNAWAGDAALQEDAARAMQRGERLIQDGHYKE